MPQYVILLFHFSSSTHRTMVYYGLKLANHVDCEREKKA